MVVFENGALQGGDMVKKPPRLSISLGGDAVQEGECNGTRISIWVHAS